MNCIMTADKLKTMRLAAGVDQGDLAQRLGMDASRLCKMERGQRSISEVEALRLQAALIEMVEERNAAFAEARKAATP